MQNQDFKVWWGEFSACFPNIAATFAQHGQESLKAWSRTLEPCELPDALAAVRGLHSGTVELPRNWSEIPRVIRDAAAGLRVRRIAAEIGRTREPAELADDNGKCQLCGTFGLVLRRDSRGRPLGLACPCPEGDRWALRVDRNGNRRELPRYVPPSARRFPEFDDCF